MNGFELLFWTAAVTVMLVMVRRNEPKLWLAFGVVAGLGSTEQAHHATHWIRARRRSLAVTG